MERNTRLSLLFGAFVAAGAAHAGTILVSNNTSGAIGEYTTSGATVNASLITGLSDPGSLTLSGSDLYVEVGGDTIGEYTTGGATLNASFITSGLDNVHQISAFGSDIFVANGDPTDTIGEYTTAGATVNSALISGVDVAHGAASNGTDIFVVNNGSGASGTGFISEYNTSGGLVNASLITGLSSPEEMFSSWAQTSSSPTSLQASWANTPPREAP
jgi:hypothetical protein